MLLKQSNSSELSGGPEVVLDEKMGSKSFGMLADAELKL